MEFSAGHEFLEQERRPVTSCCRECLGETGGGPKNLQENTERKVEFPLREPLLFVTSFRSITIQAYIYTNDADKSSPIPPTHVLHAVDDYF
ncbi:hypothetical protein OUZ56_013780 [Daphnia magna]|uniref:Uncharacterized protein n=1 Tax=Daphnia magna TaxID=35525 RepID=A0ABQ9Z6W7_9CRUS|nr:hypothetical protein OUZ56_013780 [Daphnia magna]